MQSAVHYTSLLNYIPLYEHMKIYLLIHLLMDISLLPLLAIIIKASVNIWMKNMSSLFLDMVSRSPELDGK